MALRHRDSGGDAKALRGLATFEGFTDHDLDKIAQSAGHATLPANWPLLHENTPADAAYIVLGGRLAVYVHGTKVAEIGPGELVGEAALRQGKLRNATITTVERSEFLRLGKEELEGLLNDVPRFREAIEQAAARHQAGAKTPENS